ncbi:unnamed protein product [Rotaria sp. Silwood1]|nr:unnamed protein product [Rotaria sp. Silwood1]
MLCYSVAYSHLRRLEVWFLSHEENLSNKTKFIPNFELNIKPWLDNFIQQHIRPLESDYEYKIALIGYDYEDERLAYDIEQQSHVLTASQKRLIESLCYRKSQYEKAKMEKNLSEQRLKEKKLLKSLTSIDIPRVPCIETIVNTTKRQQLIYRHQKILQDYKNEMMNLFNNIADEFVHETEILFNQEMATFWQDQHSLPAYQRFTSKTLNLIEHRLSTIAEKMKFIHYDQYQGLDNNISHI